jgi:hypothetical protein
VLNQCTPQKKKECLKNSGVHIELACSTCEAREPYEPSDWFNHIWLLYELQRGGYPFEKNDLTINEWIDIGVLRTEMEIMKTGLGK